jgi:peptidoglycan/LPS O-acetylase OafA/YrhL
MTSPSPAAAPRQNAIGFLRLVLASMVICSHTHVLGGFAEEPLFRWTGRRVALGPLVVYVFFALSGCLVAENFRHSRSVFDYLGNRCASPASAPRFPPDPSPPAFDR